MEFQRSSGVLLHVSSLPSYGGIGDLGPAAYDFVGFLAAGKAACVAGSAVVPDGLRQLAVRGLVGVCGKSLSHQSGVFFGLGLDRRRADCGTGGPGRPGELQRSGGAQAAAACTRRQAIFSIARPARPRAGEAMGTV